MPRGSRKNCVLGCGRSRDISQGRRESMGSMSRAHSAGAGACVITDAWAGIDQFFEPGREILVAESAEDVVSFLGEIPCQGASDIGKAMRGRALRDHTYGLRAQQVHQALQMESIASPKENSISVVHSFT